MGAVEKPCEESHQSGVGRCEIYRAAHHQAVASLELRRGLIHQVIEHALALFRAPVTGDAAPDVLAADLDGLRFDALPGENLFHFP